MESRPQISVTNLCALPTSEPCPGQANEVSRRSFSASNITIASPPPHHTAAATAEYSNLLPTQPKASSINLNHTPLPVCPGGCQASHRQRASFDLFFKGGTPFHPGEAPPPKEKQAHCTAAHLGPLLLVCVHDVSHVPGLTVLLLGLPAPHTHTQNPAA